MKQRQLLVTSGATVAFEALLRAVLAKGFLQTLSRAGYSRAVVQYGTSSSAEALVRTLTRSYTTLLADEKSNTLNGHCGDLELVLVAFDAHLVSKYTKHSTTVISHAGTGSIMDTLRSSDAQLYVFVNKSLQDNHQQQIANAFATLGVLTVAEIGNLDTLLGGDAPPAPHKLSPPMGSVVEQIVASGLLARH